MFVPIPVPAPIFVTGYVILELILGVTGTQAGVAHFAHLGGALVGFVLIRYWRQRASPRY
ncbi:MAG TPA: rhomboid family intramembrane serine protease, partial [Rhodanobacteraceae bacterium]|nr:rhomboid family intramembrane serine protease [Rhodanobacteraceae bacterium]